LDYHLIVLGVNSCSTFFHQILHLLLFNAIIVHTIIHLRYLNGILGNKMQQDTNLTEAGNCFSIGFHWTAWSKCITAPSYNDERIGSIILKKLQESDLS
jgi:hypothetical protein